MSMDVLVLGNMVILDYERLPGDVTPPPKNGSIISEAHWKALVGEPTDEKSFIDLEKEFIAGMGWTTE